MSVEETRSLKGMFDRRNKPRIYVPFPAKVHGVDDKGTEFNIETVLDNVSANGLYVRMLTNVEEGEKLSVGLSLNTPSHIAEGAPQVSIDGVVLRRDRKAGGVWGVAVAFDAVRFL